MLSPAASTNVTAYDGTKLAQFHVEIVSNAPSLHECVPARFAADQLRLPHRQTIPARPVPGSAVTADQRLGPSLECHL